MTENGGTTRTDQSRRAGPGSGSFLLGLLESFGVYAVGVMLLLAAVALTGSGRRGEGPVALLIVLVSFGFSLGLGVWHGTRGQSGTATGVLLGTVLWPAIAVGLLMWAVVDALGHTTIPF